MHITSLSLIIFTVLMQTAAGLMLASELAQPGGNGARRPQLALCLPMALALGVFSLLFASAHLASPLSAIFVLNNVFSSGLSLEILFCSIFIGCMVLTLFLRANGAAITSLFAKISTVAGLAAIGSIANVYTQDTIPTFNTSGTLLSFLGTGCLVGGVLGSLLYGLGLKKAPVMAENNPPAKSFVFVALLGLGLEFVASPLNMMARSYAGAYGTTGVEAMLTNATTECLPYTNALIVAGLLACLLGWVGSLKNKTPSPLINGSAMGFVCVLAGTLALRYFFYESYIRLGI